MSKSIENYILNELIKLYGNKNKALIIYNNSSVLKYLDNKSNAIHGNSKSRRSLGAWYSIYVMAKMYINKGFYNKKNAYLHFSGFHYMDIFNLQRKLYGGEKLQNHALNSRTNDEFINKITHDENKHLILKNNGYYWLNPYYLYVNKIDITYAIVNITEKYISILKGKDHRLSDILRDLKSEKDLSKKVSMLETLINEDSEARIFEIISYAILYSHFINIKVYFGWSKDSIKEKQLKLYKTGRTNANDGGIDFVMKPLGRFFQVTEVDNYNKYLMDLDKNLLYPMTFVVKTNKSSNQVKAEIIHHIKSKFGGLKAIENKYINAIESVITINELKTWLKEIGEQGINEIIKNINKYYKIEFDIIDY